MTATTVHRKSIGINCELIKTENNVGLKNDFLKSNFLAVTFKNQLFSRIDISESSIPNPLEIFCSYPSKHGTDFQWFKEGNPIEMNAHNFIYCTEKSSSLKIINPSVDCKGVYTCSMKSSLGEAKTTIKIDIIGNAPDSNSQKATMPLSSPLMNIQFNPKVCEYNPNRNFSSQLRNNSCTHPENKSLDKTSQSAEIVNYFSQMKSTENVPILTNCINNNEISQTVSPTKRHGYLSWLTDKFKRGKNVQCSDSKDQTKFKSHSLSDTSGCKNELLAKNTSQISELSTNCLDPDTQTNENINANIKRMEKFSQSTIPIQLQIDEYNDINQKLNTNKTNTNHYLNCQKHIDDLKASTINQSPLYYEDVFLDNKLENNEDKYNLNAPSDSKEINKQGESNSQQKTLNIISEEKPINLPLNSSVILANSFSSPINSFTNICDTSDSGNLNNTNINSFPAKCNTMLGYNAAQKYGYSKTKTMLNGGIGYVNDEKEYLKKDSSKNMDEKKIISSCVTDVNNESKTEKYNFKKQNIVKKSEKNTSDCLQNAKSALTSIAPTTLQSSISQPQNTFKRDNLEIKSQHIIPKIPQRNQNLIYAINSSPNNTISNEVNEPNEFKIGVLENQSIQTNQIDLRVLENDVNQKNDISRASTTIVDPSLNIQTSVYSCSSVKHEKRHVDTINDQNKLSGNNNLNIKKTLPQIFDKRNNSTTSVPNYCIEEQIMPCISKNVSKSVIVYNDPMINNLKINYSDNFECFNQPAISKRDSDNDKLLTTPKCSIPNQNMVNKMSIQTTPNNAQSSKYDFQDNGFSKNACLLKNSKKTSSDLFLSQSNGLHSSQSSEYNPEFSLYDSNTFPSKTSESGIFSPSQTYSFEAGSLKIFRSNGVSKRPKKLKTITPLGADTIKDVDPRKHFKFNQQLGHGKFGDVFLSENIESKDIYAVKVIKTIKPIRHSNGDIMEVAILKTIGFEETIISFFTAYEFENKCYIFTEYVGGGDLNDRILSEENLDEMISSQIIRQILLGLLHLKKNSILHLDLKPQNIMMVSSSGYKLKIIDLGLARFFDPNKSWRNIGGTVVYSAPETINYEPYNFSTDIWSVAVITYELLSGITPFEVNSSDDWEKELTTCQITNKIITCSYTFDEEGIRTASFKAKNFIEQILQLKTHARPSVEQCLSHPWITDIENLPSVRRTVSLRRRNTIHQRNLNEVRRFSLEEF